MTEEEELWHEKFCCSSKNGSNPIFFKPQCVDCKYYRESSYHCYCKTVYKDKHIPDEIFDGDKKCSGFHEK